MKNLIIVFILLSTLLYSNDFIEVSASHKTCDNSPKKYEGRILNLLIQKKYKNSIFNIGYIDILEQTYQPPMKSDLEVQKINFKYSYIFSKKIKASINYGTISDNLMPTDGGKLYGASIEYKTDNKIALSTAYYSVIYDDFDVQQFDFAIAKKRKSGKFLNSAKVIAKNIIINDYQNTIFSPKSKFIQTKNDYLTVGIMFGTKYQDYFGKMGVFIGDRLFAVMNQGYMVQHHAMEVGNSMMLAIGKDFKNITATFRYNQHTATSIPANNENIELKMGTLIVKYKF